MYVAAVHLVTHGANFPSHLEKSIIIVFIGDRNAEDVSHDQHIVEIYPMPHTVAENLIVPTSGSCWQRK